MYCKKCGAPVGDQDAFCPKCGYSLPRYERPANQGQYSVPNPNIPPQPQQAAPVNKPEVSDKSGVVILILAILVGSLGVHSFYAGRVGIGIAQLFTLGGCGIWTLVDIIMLATGSYRDGDGKLVELK